MYIYKQSTVNDQWWSVPVITKVMQPLCLSLLGQYLEQWSLMQQESFILYVLDIPYWAHKMLLLDPKEPLWLAYYISFAILQLK